MRNHLISIDKLIDYLWKYHQLDIEKSHGIEIVLSDSCDDIITQLEDKGLTDHLFYHIVVARKHLNDTIAASDIIKPSSDTVDF